MDKECRICKGKSHLYFIKNELKYFKCTDCGFIFLIEDKYTYDTNYNSILDVHSKNEITYYIKLLNKYIKTPASILDVGCGLGTMKATFESFGYTWHGIDLVKNNGVIFADIMTYKNEKQNRYDVILMDNSLEHMLNINGAINKCNELLTDNGIIILILPNTNSLYAKIFKLNWDKYHIAHVSMFNKKSLTLLMKNNNFKTLKLTSTPSISLGLRKLMTKLKFNSVLISFVCYFKREIFYKYINIIYDLFNLNGNYIIYIGKKENEMEELT